MAFLYIIPLINDSLQHKFILMATYTEKIDVVLRGFTVRLLLGRL